MISFHNVVQGMLVTLKNNARPKRKYKDRFNPGGIKKRKPVKIDISKKDLNALKSNIKKEAKAYQTRKYFLYAVTLILVTGGLVGSIYTLNKWNTEDRIRNKRHQEEIALAKRNKKIKEIENFIQLGDLALKDHHFVSAKKYYNKAYVLDNNYPNSIMAVFKGFLMDCNHTNRECNLAKYYQYLAIEAVGSTKLKNELGEEYDIFCEKQINYP